MKEETFLQKFARLFDEALDDREGEWYQYVESTNDTTIFQSRIVDIAVEVFSKMLS